MFSEPITTAPGGTQRGSGPVRAHIAGSGHQASPPLTPVEEMPPGLLVPAERPGRDGESASSYIQATPWEYQGHTRGARPRHGGDGQRLSGTVIGEEKQMGGRTQLDTLLHTPKVQSTLPDPWLHLKLPKPGGSSSVSRLPPSLPPSCPPLGAPTLCVLYPWLFRWSRPWSSVSYFFSAPPIPSGPAHPVWPLPLPLGPAPPSLQPQRPHHQRLAATCSWATFSNMTHGKGKEWELP